MKKITVIFLAIVCFVMLTACSFGSADAIIVTGKDVIYMGEFDYANYTVTYKDKKTQSIVKTETLTEDMLDDNSKMDIFGEGKKTLHIVIGNLETTFDVQINRKQFEDIGFLTTSYTYTGSYITILLEGNIPQGAETYYPLGNRFKECGVYDVKCILSHQYYETQTYTARITIERGGE